MAGNDVTGSNLSEMELRYIRRRENFLPWELQSTDTKLASEEFKEILIRRGGAMNFGKNSQVSPDAHIYTSHFELGDNSWVAPGSILRGHIVIGDDCTINPFSHLAGYVRIGNGVRIAGLVSIYAFNHGHALTDVPIYQQAHTSKGIVIGDGVWIGANAVIVDGVDIGPHSIIGGGAVVTKSCPPFSVLGGNPARVIRNRLVNDETV